MQNNMHLDNSQGFTGILSTISIITLTWLSHQMETIQPFLSSLAALVAICVGASTFIINFPKLEARLKSIFKIKK